MPGLVAGYGAFSALRKNANSIQAKAALAQGSTKTNPAPSPSAGGNPFVQMVQQLAQINANTATTANVIKASAKAEQYKMMFEEEKAREQAQQNQALIDAIKNSGMGGIAGAGKEGAAGAGGGLLSSILGNALGGMLGTVVMGALLGLRKKLAAFISQLVLSAALLFGGGGKLGKIAGALGTGARVAGKIGARFIPYVGWALLAADVAEAAVSMSGSADKSAKQNANTPNPPMQYDAMGNPTGVGPDAPEDRRGNANSPTAQRTSASKTSGLQWRVPLTVPYRVTSEFGEKSAIRGMKEHNGIDLAAPAGNFIVAAADGMVVAKSQNELSGIYVVIDHLNGMSTTYCHLAFAYEKVGQKVKIGEPIGVIGSTGRSTGVHLHFMLKRGNTPVNPRTVINFGALNKETAPKAPTTAPGGAPKGDGKRGNFDPSRAQLVPGFAAQANKKLTDNAVTAYYKALKEGKTEEEARAIASKIAGDNPTAKATLQKLSARSASVAPSQSGLIEMGDASVAELYATKRDNENNRKEVVKQLRSIKENTGVTAKAVKAGNRITMSRGRFKSPEQILAETNKRFTDGLQRQLTRTISGTLMRVLYPGGYRNVSQRTASTQMYRGEQLNKLLGLTPRLTKLGASIFGRQYGPAFGQIFSKAATGYLEIGARSVAQGIFGSMGMNSDQANILGGQILGNLAKGTKQGKLTALEQILFGVSGGTVALGPETIFAKYGFASPQDGIAYMANVLGSSIMGPVNSGLGTTPLNMRNMDPRMRTMGAFGGFGGEYGGMPTGMSGTPMGGSPSTGTLQAAAYNNPYLQLNKDGMVVIKENMPEQTKTVAEQLNVAKQAELDAKQRFLDAEAGSEERAIQQRMVSEAQYEQQILTNRLLQSRATVGSGTTIGGGSGSGGGGFFSGGGPLAEVGNMAVDLGKAAITQKVVQSMGIKNPYMAMLASFAVSKGLSFVGGKAFDLFAGTELGKSVTGAFSGAGNYISNLYGTYAPTWLGGYDAATMADLAMGQAMTANAAGSAGSAAGSSAATSSTFLQGFEFMDVLPYAAAIIQLAQGDIKGAAVTAAFTYVGTVLGGPIGGFIGSVIGSFLGRSKPRQPNPAVWRVIRVKGNNNIAAITDLQPPRESPPAGWNDFADALIRVGFNAAKAAEVETKEQSPFDFIMCSIDRDNVIISLRTGDPNSAGNDLNLGKPSKDFDAGQSASKIVKHVADAFKAAYSAKSEAIDKASKLLNSRTYATVSKGLLKELSTGKNKIDTTVEQGVFGATAAQDAIIQAGVANRPQAATSGDEYNAGSPPMIYSMKEGKYVEAPYTTETVTVNDGEGGTYQVTRKVYDTTALMYDKDGKLITDKNKSGGIDLADIVTPVLSTTSGTVITGGTTTTGGAAGTTGTGGVTVNTVADNSQTNNQSVNTYYTSLLSKSRNPIRDASVNTALPA
jgi:murein DD-endopeptidase MepM/ murein hydrolase activator NlpD